MKKIKIVFLLLGLIFTRNFIVNVYYQDFNVNNLTQITFGYECKHDIVTTYSSSDSITVHTMIIKCNECSWLEQRVEAHSNTDRRYTSWELGDSEKYHYYTRCSKCSQVFQQAHTYVNGKCECGKAEASILKNICNHNLVTECKSIANVSKHMAVTTCTKCEYRSERQETHDVVNRTWTSWENGDTEKYHYYTKCSECPQVFQQAHTYVNGKCECGKTEEIEHICKSNGWSGEYLGWLADDTYHWEICATKTCGKIINKAKHNGDMCSYCGYLKTNRVVKVPTIVHEFENNTTRVAEPVSYTEEDLYWLSKIIIAEAGGEDAAMMTGVGEVILNRVESDLYNDTIYDVIYECTVVNGVIYYQFSPVLDGNLDRADPYDPENVESVEIAKMLLENRAAGTPSNTIQNCTAFDNPRKSPNSWNSRNMNLYTTMISSTTGEPVNFYNKF